MILTFGYPASEQRTGGVAALYEFANALARRGHDVRVIHGPAPVPSWFEFDRAIVHLHNSSLDDPSLPSGDVVFSVDAPERLGLPCGVVQGYRMLSREMEHHVFRARAPKVCVAKWLIDIGVSLGVPVEQLWHVPCGMDHRTFARRTPLEARTFDVAFLHHAHSSKGWAVAAAALDELRRLRPDLDALVFGMMPLDQEIHFGLPLPPEPVPGWATFVEGASHRRLADEVYNATKVYVQASNFEGFGLTAIEAMACGAALVTTDNGGSQDYAIDGETALVVPVGDAPALARAVDSLLGDDALRCRIAAEGTRYIRRFDWDVGAATIEGHLEDYLADPAAFRAEPAPFDEAAVS